MQLTVNGKTHDHQGGGTVPALLAELGAHPDHSALTVNGDVIPSRQWETHPLKENDSIEVLTFVGGG